MHRRAGHGDLMEPSEVVGDPAGAKVILLPQIHDLADDVRGRRPWRMMRGAWPIAQPRLAVATKAPFPLVEGLARDPEVAAGLGDASTAVRRVRQDLVPPGDQPEVLGLRHGFSAPGAPAP